MRILFVTGEYPPMIGGVGAYTAALAHALVDAGADVAVFTSALAHAAQGDSVPTYATTARWNPNAWRAIVHQASAIQADWVHVQYQTAAYGMNPSLNLMAHGMNSFRLAWTYHDLLPPYLFPKAGARLRTWITQRPVHRADLVIVTNEGDRQQLAAQSANVYAIPIGSNIKGITLEAGTRAAQRGTYGYGETDLVLGFFGFLNRSKGSDTLVAALDALVRQGTNAHLLMIGDRLGASDPSNAATLAEIETLIAARGLTQRVRWTGRLDDESAGAALNAVDLLLLPYADGASLRRGTLMAGLANGCAIITTQPQHPVPELVEGRDLIYVPPGNPAALAAAAASLAANPEQVAQLRAAARTSSAQFRWSAIAQTHQSLYRAAETRRRP